MRSGSTSALIKAFGGVDVRSEGKGGGPDFFRLLDICVVVQHPLALQILYSRKSHLQISFTIFIGNNARTDDFSNLYRGRSINSILSVRMLFLVGLITINFDQIKI